MQQEDLRPWAEQVQTYHMPRYDELPAIDLYMDQVVAILEDCLRLFLRDAQLETRDVRAMYDGFCAMQERAVISALERAAAQAGGDRSDMALRVAAEANVGKMIAEKIMDVHFPAPSREKKREKE